MQTPHRVGKINEELQISSAESGSEWPYQKPESSPCEEQITLRQSGVVS